MTLCVVIGEASGDILAAQIITQLKEHHPELHLFGITGPKLRQAGVKTLFEMERLRVMGLTHVLRKLPTIYSCFKTVEQFLLKNPTATLLAVDSPSLSMKLAHRLKKKGFRGKIIQLVAPSVWAWGEGRSAICARCFDRLLTLYRFEPSYFEKSGLPTNWIGHPLIEQLPQSTISREPLIALFPGSRPFEIQANLRIQLQAIKRAFEQIAPRPLAISLAPGISDQEQENINHLLKQYELSAELVPEEKRYQLMQRASLALAKSGTVTLELALLSTPTLITYHLTKLNHLYIKYILKPKITLFGLPNILSGQKLFPEHIIPPISVELIAQDIVHILETPQSADFSLVRQAVDPGSSPINLAVRAIEEEIC